MARAAQSPEAGFTLVEMLVSLTLLGMAAALMLEGLGSAQKLWAGEAARTARGETIEAAQGALRARIERLQPITRFDAGAPVVDIEGGPRQMVFVGPPAEADRPAAVRRYRLALSDRGDLLLGAAASRTEAGQGEPSYSNQVLLRDVERLEISYYGPDAAGAAAQWWSDWTPRATPPELVKIRLALKTGDRRVWPELVVHPAAAVDSLCSINSTSGLCRGRE